MSILVKVEIQLPKVIQVVVSSDSITVDLDDSRTITVPLAWYPRLLQGTQNERNNWRRIGDGEGIHWPDLDEDLSVEGLITGRPSGEGHDSFQKWLISRKK